MSRRTYCNLDETEKSRALVVGYTNSATARVQNFTRESDLQNCRFFFVKEVDDSTGQAFVWEDCTTWQLIVGAGILNLKPTGGSFQLTDPDLLQTTGPIAWDATAADVQLAVRSALANWSLATVTGAAGGPWTITNSTLLELPKLNATSTSLQPAGSTCLVSRSEPGVDTLLPAQMFVELARALPIGRSSGWTAISKIPTAVTVEQPGDATHNKVFKIKIDPDAYSGDVQLLFTGDSVAAQLKPIAFNATAEDVKASFEEHPKVGEDGVSVVKEGPGEWYVTLLAADIDLDNTPTLTSPGDTIKVPPGLEGSLNIHTAGVSLALNGAASTTITFEIRVNRGDGWEVVAQVPNCPLYANLIRAENGVSSAIDPTPTLTQVITVLPGVTGYTGGTSANLDGLATIDLSVGRWFAFRHATHGLRFYALDAGTDAEASPGIIRPDDYAGGTNEKVWKAI